MSYSIICHDQPVLSPEGYPVCESGWQMLDTADTSSSLTNLLQSISDFSPAMVVTYVSIYLIAFSLGITAGIVYRQLKRL